jgi:hypothetical protein
MPYPFAHPAAVLPLVPLMGRFAVPSALGIGSVSPDLWHLVPLASRHLSHSTPGLLLFCLPAGVAAYLIFHLVLKDPCISLLPGALAGRVRGFAVRGLPKAPLYAVVGSLALGALTHWLWDSMTGSAHAPSTEHVDLLKHASTLLGTLVLGWWLWRKLRSVAPSAPDQGVLSPQARVWAWATLLGAAAICAAGSISEWPELSSARQVAKTAGLAGAQGFVGASILYCLALSWRTRWRRSAVRQPD